MALQLQEESHTFPCMDQLFPLQASKASPFRASPACELALQTIPAGALAQRARVSSCGPV
jgi:hypothetical protein